MAIWPEPSARRTRATAVFRRPVPIVYCFGAVFVSATCHTPVSSRRTDFNPFYADERIEIRSTQKRTDEIRSTQKRTDEIRSSRFSVLAAAGPDADGS